jgi:aldehyde dehydrogenase (NAD(P)+)
LQRKPRKFSSMELAQSPRALDTALIELRSGAEAWAVLPVREKADLLRDLRAAIAALAPQWVAEASRAKGIAGTPIEGEEWISGPWAVLYALNRYVITLEEIARCGRPQVPAHRIQLRQSGQIVVHVFPTTIYERLLFCGLSADVWMDPALTPQDFTDSLATWYQSERREPRVALVLGAGNIASIGPLDVLYKLVAEGAVCMLKMSPVNEYLGPILDRALAPLVERGFLRIAYGGADVGIYLCSHPNVDEIHVTGSGQTHDAIVFEHGIRKPITSELGNVSPTIVVPGRWSDRAVQFQAESIVTQKLHNAGFNCIAAQVLVLPEEWGRTPALIAAIERVMRTAADRPAYYPGAVERVTRLTSRPGGVERFGKSGEGFAPRSLVHVKPSPGERLFSDEAFGSVLGVLQLPGSTETFLGSAVEFANEQLHGTLGANIIVDPLTLRTKATAVDAAIAALRYGCIGVNAWTGAGYFITETPWGAFPGHTTEHIQSGIGVVHNSRLFSRSQKSVVYAPFIPFPKPPWFVTNRSADSIGKALCDFEVNQNPLTAAKVAMHALGG